MIEVTERVNVERTIASARAGFVMRHSTLFFENGTSTRIRVKLRPVAAARIRDSRSARSKVAICRTASHACPSVHRAPITARPRDVHVARKGLLRAGANAAPRQHRPCSPANRLTRGQRDPLLRSVAIAEEMRETSVFATSRYTRAGEGP